MSHRPRIAVEPSGHENREWLAAAVEAGGGEVVEPGPAEGLVWAANTGIDALRAGVAQASSATWVQLPWAGVEPFVDALDHDHIWTCGKGVYAEPVAELALTLTLAGLRKLDHYTRVRDWQPIYARNLVGANVVILGGGGITQALLGLLSPFDCKVTVLRNRPAPMVGAERVATLAELDEVLPDADVVVLALALTPETRGVLGEAQLARMKSSAWIINVARGAHIDTDALVAALERHSIGGAGLDVFPEEPLPADHPLWRLSNCILTPHVGNDQRMAEVYLSKRVTDNVRRFGAGAPLLGLVDVDLGY
jgi:phosphoglycerate dehydrogenase-like enzyme